MKHWYLPTSAGGKSMYSIVPGATISASDSAGSPRAARAALTTAAGDVVERLGAAAAEVEDAARLGVGEEPEVDRDHVVDEDEIARLLAGAVAAVRAEQLDAALRCETG